MDTQKDKDDTIPADQTLKAGTDVGNWYLPAFLGILVLYTVLRINIIGVPLERDEGLFGYVGQVLLDGGMPYTDAIDHKPPMVYVIYALALLLFSPTASGIHIFLHIYNFFTLVVLFITAKRYTGSVSSGLWTALVYAVFSSLPTIQGFSATTEMFLLLPLSISLYFAILSLDGRHPFPIFASGFFGAMACWTKHTGFFFSAFVLLVVVVSGIKREAPFMEKIKKILTGFFPWIIGAISFSGVVIFIFFINGALEDLYFWGFKYNFSYTQVVDSEILFKILLERSLDILKSSCFIIGLGMAVTVYKIFRRESIGWFLSGMLFFSFIAVLPGYGYSHYFAQISLGVSFAGGLGISFIQKFPQKELNRWLYGCLYVLVITGAPVLVHSTYYMADDPAGIAAKLFFGNIFSESPELSKYIAERTEADDSVFVFGSEAQIHFYSDRRSPTRFVLMYPMMNADYPGYLDFQKEAWEDVEKSKPRYIVEVNVPASFSWDGKADLFLARKINQLLKNDYKPEAVVTVDYPKGKLIPVQNMADPFMQIRNKAFPAIVYRRK